MRELPQMSVRHEIDNEVRRRLRLGEGSAKEEAERITHRLALLTDTLLKTFDDQSRDELARERATLIRMRQVLEGDRGERELSSYVEDAPDLRSTENSFAQNDKATFEGPANPTLTNWDVEEEDEGSMLKTA